MDGVVGRKDFCKEEAQPRGPDGWGGPGLQQSLGGRSGIRAGSTSGFRKSLSIEF